MPKHLLESLEVSEISLVSKDARPANEGARILLTKTMNEEIISKEETVSKGQADLILKLEVALETGDKAPDTLVNKIEKLAGITDEEKCYELVSDFAKYLKDGDPELTFEGAFSAAMETLPVLAGVAMGKSVALAKGSY